VEVKLFFKKNKERTSIDVIGSQKMECNIRDAVASMPQSRNKLENRRGTNNEMPREMWKEIENKTDEARMAKVARERRNEGKEIEKEEGRV